MIIDRRHFLSGAAGSIGALAAAPVRAAPLSRYGLDASSFGVRADSSEDQSRVLQRAIERAARTRAPLVLAPGVYRCGGITLAAGMQMMGVAGATKLVLTSGRALLAANHADDIALTGLVLDGGGQTLPKSRGLVDIASSHNFRLSTCAIRNAGGNGMALYQCDGRVTDTEISDAADTALFSRDGNGLVISGNSIEGSGNGGIRVWQSESRHDGSSIVNNTIRNTAARAGGSGQNGNAINVFRAGDVIVSGNHVDAAAFSAIRGNSASNIQIIGNSCRALDEVALYAEFAFEGAVIANNVVDGAALGVSVTNYNDGGRLATVTGNVIRNVAGRASRKESEGAGVGISVEADTTVSGNVVDHVAAIGISVGYGKYLRNVAVTGNLVRSSAYGIAVSVVPGAGDATIANNIIAEARRAAIVGMKFREVVTGDISRSGATAYPQLIIENNQVR